MNSIQRGQDEHSRPTLRKPYMTPQVQIYGDLRLITQAVGKTGMMDNCTVDCTQMDSTAP